MKAEDQSVQARFATADRVMSERVNGLASAPSSLPAHEAVGDQPAGESGQADGKVIITVPIELVFDNQYNARRRYSEARVRSRAASLARDGQKVAAPAAKHPTIPGAYMLIDGGYRKKGLLYLGKTTIDLAIEEVKNELDFYRLSRLYNTERDDQCALDDALAWQQLLDEGKVASHDEIAVLADVTKGTVSKTLALLKLPKSALEKVGEAPMKFGVALGYELHLIAQRGMAEEDLLALMGRVIDEDLSSRDLEGIRHRMETDRPRKKKEVSRQYKIRSDGAQIGVLKEWDSGKVALEVTVSDAKERDKLVTLLKGHFVVADADAH